MNPCEISYHEDRVLAKIKYAMKPSQTSTSKLDARDKVFFISKGQAVIFLDGRVFGTVSAPSFVGLINIFHQDEHLKQEIFLTEDTVAHEIPSNDAANILKNKGVDDSISFLISKNALSFINHIMRLKKQNTYNIIKHSILYYHKHSIRLQEDFSLSKFTIDFTGISKSRVMLILKELKKGGYIETTKNGRLVKINKLPDNF
jgi:CRP-like cAMP-binding protein